MSDAVGTIGTPEKEEPWMFAFITALCDGFSVSRAAKLAGVPRRTAYNYRESNADFRAVWDDAVDCGTDLLEDEAKLRATEGTVETEEFNDSGVLVKRVVKKSDTLLIFLLKARRPEKFRERVDLKHSGEVELSSLLADDPTPPAAEPPKETPNAG